MAARMDRMQVGVHCYNHKLAVAWAVAVDEVAAWRMLVVAGSIANNWDILPATGFLDMACYLAAWDCSPLACLLDTVGHTRVAVAAVVVVVDIPLNTVDTYMVVVVCIQVRTMDLDSLDMHLPVAAWNRDSHHHNSDTPSGHMVAVVGVGTIDYCMDWMDFSHMDCY